MRLLTIIAFTAMAAIAASSTASAGSGCEANSAVQALFEGADQNRDGSLSRAEYETAGLQEYGVSFDESDANADGETTLAEYLELYERHHPPAGELREA